MLHTFNGFLPAVVLILGVAPALADTPLPARRLPAGAVARLGTMRLRHRQQAFDAAFSPDGKYVVSVGQESTIRLWEASTGQPVRNFATEQGMMPVSIAYSVDGKYVATGDGRGDVHLWNAATGKLAHRFQEHTDLVTVVAFSSDSRTLASSSRDGTVRLWDVAGKRQRHVLKGHTSKVWAVAISRDGRLVASGGSDGLVKLWDANSGRERATLRGHQGDVHMVAISADSRKVASGSQDRTVKVWDAASAKLERTLEGHPGAVVALAFAPTGMLLAAGCRRSDDRDTEVFGEVHLWVAATGKRRAILKGHRGFVNSVSFAPDGQTLLSVGMEGLIRFWDVASGRERCSLPGHARSVRALAWSRDGQTLVSTSDDATVRLWDLKGGLSAVKERAVLRGHFNRVTAAAIAPVGHTLATGDAEGRIRVWDAVSGELRYFLHRDSEVISSLDFAPDGKTFASVSENIIRVWDVAEARRSGKERRTLTPEQTVAWNTIFSPDGKMLVSAGNDSPVLLWNLSTGKSEPFSDKPGPKAQMRILNIGENASIPHNPVAFAPRGRPLAVGQTGGEIQLLDLSSKTERACLGKHEAAVQGVALTPDGKTLISGSDDGTVKLWEVVSGKERATLKGHAGPITCLALRPDGRTLATGSEDTTILLWDLTTPTGRPLPARPTDKESASIWQDLTGDDAARAFQVKCALLRQPALAVALLREKLASGKGPNAAEINRLISDLDGDEFARREKASQALKQLGMQAEPALRARSDKATSLEMRRRINVLLKGLKKEVSREQRRAARVTEVLEQLDTAEARKLLKQLAGGSADAWCRNEARASLDRLAHREGGRK
jgi:WD40 repeat protein